MREEVEARRSTVASEVATLACRILVALLCGKDDVSRDINMYHV